MNSNADKLAAFLNGFSLPALGEVVHANDGALGQTAGDDFVLVAGFNPAECARPRAQQC